MKLLEPIQVGKITLKNRIMFPPLTTGYEERDGSIGAKSFNFYKSLAQGGVGYIVIGDVAPVNTVSPTPKFFDDSQIETFKKLADSVHEFDCKLGLQLFHPEYDVAALAELFRKGDMQAARAKLHHDMIHYIDEVTKEQLDDILEKITACASRSAKAGVDIIEVHGDRLVGSLCSTILNHREDEYGGSFENRTKFALQVVEAIKKGAPDLVIDYKLPVVTENPLCGKGGLKIDEAVKLAKLLEEHGVDMLHVGQANHTGNMNDTIPAMGTRDYCFMADYAKQIKDAVSIPVSTVGRIIKPENGEMLIEKGVCDIVALGRSLLTDHEYVQKLEMNKAHTIRHCMMCNKGCTDNIQNRKFLSCVLNAENGYEYERYITPATHKKKVVIVGGGVAGMEAARVAKTKGHDVVLFEKSGVLGGQLNIAAIPPRKEEMKRGLDYFLTMMNELKIDIRLNTEATVDNIQAQNPDVVIIASGAHNFILPIEGANLVHVKDAWKILAGQEIVNGQVVIIGGGLVGCETAEYLANRGCKVSVVEMLDDIAKQESNTVKPIMIKDLEEHHVSIYTKTKVESIDIDTVHCSQEEGTIDLACDYVVFASGAKPNLFDSTGLEGIDVIHVGDCTTPNDVNSAIEQAYLAANAL